MGVSDYFWVISHSTLDVCPYRSILGCQLTQTSKHMKLATILYSLGTLFILSAIAILPYGVWHTSTYNSPGVILGFLAFFPLSFIGAAFLNLGTSAE